MSIEVYCKRFGVGGKVIPQMVLTSFLGFFAQERNQIFPFFLSRIYQTCTSKRRKVEIGSFHACIFDGNIENAICIKSRAPCELEHRRRRGRVVCSARATAAAYVCGTCVKETAAEIKPRISLLSHTERSALF